jgi:polyphosphate kinase 2 (PPK2 family)
VELVKLQEWTKNKGLKGCIVFEGRDGAGNGGAINAITERVSPRVFRVLALAAPTEREKSQWFVVRSDGKKRARLNIIGHLLSQIPYKDAPREAVSLPKQQKPGGYREPNYPFKFNAETY